VNQIHPSFQPARRATPSEIAITRQPSRWSKSFWTKNARLPQKRHRSIGPAEASAWTEYGAEHREHEKSPRSDSEWSRDWRQLGQ